MHNPTLLESNFLRREKSVSESDNFLLLKKVRIEHKSVVLSTLGFRFTQFSIYTVLCQNIIISFKLCSSCFLCCKWQKMTSYYFVWMYIRTICFQKHSLVAFAYARFQFLFELASSFVSFSKDILICKYTLHTIDIVLSIQHELFFLVCSRKVD